MFPKGRITIEKYKTELIDGEYVIGEHTGTYTAENRLSIAYADAMIRGDSSGRGDLVAAVSEGIFTGAQGVNPEDTLQFYLRGSVTNPTTYTAAVGPVDAFWEFSSSIGQPGVERNIRTIVLRSTDTNQDNRAATIVNLPEPCVHGATEQLFITYRLINDQSAIAATNSVNSNASESLFLSNVGQAISGGGDYALNDVFVTQFDSRIWGKGIGYKQGSQYDLQSNVNIGEWYYNSITNAWTNLQVAEGFVSSQVFLRVGKVGDINQPATSIGYPIKGCAIGNNNAYVTVADVPKGTSSVQNIFGRIADIPSEQRRPYLDGNIIGGPASINLIDKGDWYEHRADSYLLPYQYRVKMVAGGLTGVATYTLQRRRGGHWVDNAPQWIPGGIGIHHGGLMAGAVDEVYMDITTASTRKHGQTVWHSRSQGDQNGDTFFNRSDTGDTGTLIIRYVWPEAISFDYDGITVFSVQEHNWTNLDANSGQAQTFTEILQVSTDGRDIYIADASQGLYKVERDVGDFDTTNWTITKLSPPGITDTDSCRGVFHKGGTYWGGPGKLVDVDIIRAGSNYAVDDTITITGVNGTSAAANVSRVDADGGITGVAITNQGSGYIEDHCQLYVSSGSGWGAAIEPVIGAGGDMWAIFNDATDNAVYMSNMTHVGSNDYTSLAFDNSNPYLITRTGGTDFLADGFRVGQALIVRSPEEVANEGRYTISAVTSTVITVTEAITTTNATDTQAQIFAEKWEVMKETITTTETVTFATPANTIFGSGTSFITQGFVEGMKIVVSGSASNNSIFTIADVTATLITLDSQATVVAEVGINCTIAALTDFTITDYTANATEGAGIIGLLLDHDDPEYKFAILTPGAKVPNNGTTLQATAGWDWWSHFNSTGTTAAGGTDRIRALPSAQTVVAAAEQIATLTLGPTSAIDGGTEVEWLGLGTSNITAGRIAWGGTATIAVGNAGMYCRYAPHRCRTNFEIGVLASGTQNAQILKSNRVIADYTASTSDAIINYDQLASDTGPIGHFPGYYEGNHGLHGYLGHGMILGRMVNDLSRGGFVYSGNGDGVLANEDLLPYGFWQDFGWDGTRWVLDNVNARTTHAQVSFSGTGITITAATGVIVGAGFASTDWAGDGFLVGDIITIANSEDPTNDGDYVIETLSGTTLTVTPDKLPAINSSAAPDITATVVGDHAIMDGLALSFDDNGGAAAFIVNEYYDCHVYDGILNDNATTGNFTTYAPWAATDSGTVFESSTIPNSDVGEVFNELITARQKSTYIYASGGPWLYSEPGVMAGANYQTAQDEIMFTDQQIPANTDFTFRFKLAGVDNLHRMETGITPYALSADQIQYNDASLDYNIRVTYDFVNYPAHDLYTIAVQLTGGGAIQYTENADRVILIAGQDETFYDGAPGTEGTFIGGYESATDLHAALDILTMNDGTLITVDAVDGNGTVTQFTVTTNSTKSSGNGQIDAVSSSATLIDFNTTGNVITRTAGGTNFVTDGFKIGMKIQVDGATTELNDGAYTIQSVTTTTIVTEENLNTTETGTSATIDHAIVQVSTTGSGVNFALIPGADNLQAADVGTDEFAINRRGTTGNNLYWTLNGVEFFTHVSGPFNAQYNPSCTPNNTIFGAVYDASLDYTIDRRYLYIGNGTTTGAKDINFRCLPTTLAGTDDFRLYYDSGSGPVEFVYVLDGATAPASGEVTILPFSGRLWFNTAQAGNTLTGNWTFTKKINLE